jgi:hypothetical protein
VVAEGSVRRPAYIVLRFAREDGAECPGGALVARLFAQLKNSSAPYFAAGIVQRNADDELNPGIVQRRRVATDAGDGMDGGAANVSDWIVEREPPQVVDKECAGEVVQEIQTGAAHSWSSVIEATLDSREAKVARRDESFCRVLD